MPVLTVRAGSKPWRIASGQRDIGALGHLEADLDVFGRILACGADALDHRRELGLVPFDALRQVGDHGEIAIDKADGAGVLAAGAACLGSAGGVADLERGGKARGDGLHLLGGGVDLALQGGQKLDGKLGDLASGQVDQLIDAGGVLRERHGGLRDGGWGQAASRRRMERAGPAWRGLVRAMAM